MSFSSLQNLHSLLEASLNRHTYIAEASKSQFKESSTKSIRLNEVFKLASSQIEKELKKARSPKDLSDQQVVLLFLKRDGELHYQRYTKAVNSWSRSFFKKLAYYTPSYLKPFLPPCFSNKMEGAEKITQQAYQAYINTIDQYLNQQFPLKDKDDVLKEEEADKDLDVGQPTNPPPALTNNGDLKGISDTPIFSSNEIEKKRQETLTFVENRISKQLNYLNQFDQHPFSLTKYKRVLQDLRMTVLTMKELEPQDVEQKLEKLGLNKKCFEFFLSQEVFAALATNQDENLLNLLKATETSWPNSFEKASQQQDSIRFGLQKLGNSTMLKLNPEKGGRFTEGNFKNYQGRVILTFNSTTQFEGDSNEFEQLIKFLKANDQCRPYQIEIQIESDLKVNSNFFKLLLNLSKFVSDIKLTGLETLNLKELSKDDEDEFIQHLDRFYLPNLKEVIMSDHPKDQWTPSDFSNLLAFCPNLSLFQECYLLCSTPQQIVIPPQVCEIQILDLSSYSLEHIPYLLQQFKQPTLVKLSGLAITDHQLKSWIKAGMLSNVVNLQLDNCSSLTTDSLHDLATLSKLTLLSLPDLPQGKLALGTLPKMENPFRINLFYTPSKVTQAIASDLYTGPIAWAPAFQIPLARQGVDKIFTSQQTILDSKSVAYWLQPIKKLNDSDKQKWEFQNLKSHTDPKLQPSIKTIIADSNEFLNDENIDEFFQKFPKITEISLYNCPNISENGVIQLLNACPQIRKLDLTSCPLITDQFLYTYADILSNLEKLTVTDTGVSNATAELFENQWGKKFIFQNATLKITNDQLIDDDALNNLLKSQTLNQLKCIDLTDCQNLTNKMLGQLLDYLNAAIWVNASNGLQKDNPQRLNIATLNLTRCYAISDEAFSDLDTNGKLQPKLLEKLACIVTEGTQISPVLEQLYPSIVFQKVRKPLTIQINPEEQLQSCLAYYQSKEQASQGDAEAQIEVKKLGENFIHNRLVVELFKSDLKDPALTYKVLEQPIDIKADEFYNFTLSFKTKKMGDSPLIVKTHRDLLCNQSPFFFAGFRPGETISKNSGLDFDNLSSLKAAQLMQNLLLGKTQIEELKVEDINLLIETKGTTNYNTLECYYQSLFDRLHSKFDLFNAEKFFKLTVMLNDEEGKEQYEETLIAYLDELETDMSSQSEATFQKIRELAHTYNLTKLEAKAEEVGEKRSLALALQLS